ncbi:TPA: hypothetical protein SLZ51_002356 [Vibrio cholerae]|uniref:Uncharacterized protein n=1 Tax=Vibrio vulnificus TaxID=672 RepID=A0AAI8ZLE9_VIBVL|nr:MULTISPECIES: hypothetical protein [Vibrio]EHU8077661.1 hypothetical protein [Vibrio cholerae]EHV9953717.1 hypothetical protein [Vibrio cholerae]EKF9218942.1 hypothetical protein [Vibrio cholerae]OQK43810.1 hypothetical protein XM75_u0091 [Vibrio vulnificus]CDM12465.1 hypothetical protein [Vibrio vulnificus]
MARTSTYDWSSLLALLFQRQKDDPKYKIKNFAEDEGVPIGSLTRAITQYRKGKIEVSDNAPIEHDSDRKSDLNNDRLSDRKASKNNQKKQGKTNNKQEVKKESDHLDGARARNSDRSLSQTGAKRNRGGQAGNNNAVKHGLYARHLSQEIAEAYEAAFDAAGGIDHELALARAKLAEAFRLKGQQEYVERCIAEEQAKKVEEPDESDSSEDGEPSFKRPSYFNHAAMRAEAFEDNIGPLGTTIKMRRVDWDAVIDRWMGRIANLESLRQKLLQGSTLTYSEQLAIKSTVFNQLANEEIGAVTAGHILSANGLDIPPNLLAQIRFELGEGDDDDSELPTGAVTPQMVEERERQLQLGNQQSSEEFLAERMAELEALEAEDRHGS